MIKTPLTKSEFVLRLAEKCKLSPKVTALITKNILNTLTHSLTEHQRVEIRGFGSFESRLRKSRQVRNPKTGDRLEAPDSYTVHFKPGKELRERVNLTEFNEKNAQ